MSKATILKDGEEGYELIQFIPLCEPDGKPTTGTPPPAIYVLVSGDCYYVNTVDVAGITIACFSTNTFAAAVSQAAELMMGIGVPYTVERD